MKQAALSRQTEAAEEREQPTCPICRCEFYATESPEQVDAHLTSCSRKAAAAAAAAVEAAATAEAAAAAAATAGSTDVNANSAIVNLSSTGSTRSMGNTDSVSSSTNVNMNMNMRAAGVTNNTATAAAAAAAAAADSPMPMALSSALMIGLKGEDLGGLVSAVEEVVASGVRPTTALIDRAMQQIIKSRCAHPESRTRKL